LPGVEQLLLTVACDTDATMSARTKKTCASVFFMDAA
jgi:hypothetical protein